MKAGTSLPGRATRNALAFFLIVLAAAVCAAGWAPAARAGGPGAWTTLGGNVGSLLVQPSLARGPFGALQVVWITEGTPQSLIYRPVAADGTPGAGQVVAAGWNSLSNPDIVDVASSDTVRVFAGGMDGGSHDGLNVWFSGDGGASWALQPGMISGPGGTAYSSDVSAVLGATAYFETWSSSYGVYVHRSFVNDPTADYQFNDVGDYGYDSALGYDAGNDRLYVVAAYNATGKSGLWMRRVDTATGAPTGASFALAGSSTGSAHSFDVKQMRTPITPVGGGLLVAYPTGYPASKTLRVWRVTPGGVTPATLATGGATISATSVTGDAFGRAWAVWTTQTSGRSTVYARRSNVGATSWGATVKLKGPSGTGTLWKLSASAQDDRVDVVGTFQKGGQYVLYHGQLWAGLSVTVSPKTLHSGKAATVTVTVTDAGRPLAGAKVKIGSATATTDLVGKAKFSVKLAKTGKSTVTVTKPGYVRASSSISVVH